MGHAALFLDRDGVINVDYGYVHQQEHFQFLPGIFDLCRTAQSLGFLLFVITNQAGIARGLYTEMDFHALTRWMCYQLAAERVIVQGIYFCPTHPTAGIGKYRVESKFRKPGPGMIFQASSEYHLDLARSVLIGDKLSDIEAGLAAGVGRNILLNSTPSFYPLSSAMNYWIADDLLSATRMLSIAKRELDHTI